MQFNETHPEFRGFSKFYNETIAPRLEAMEQDRLDAMARFKKQRFWIIIATVVIIVAAVLIERDMEPAFPCAFFGALAVFASYLFNFNEVERYTKNGLMQGICGFLGWSFSDKVIEEPDLSVFFENGLLPRHSGSKAFEDEISGEAHGAGFRMMECHLENRSSKNNRTIFHGAIMWLDFDKKFLGKTVVLRDKGRFQKKERAGMKRVGLVDPVFEDLFEAYGTDQVEARYILTPDFMQRLIDLEKSVDGKNIQFGFFDNQLLITVETADRFEAGDMFEPLNSQDRAQRILSEVAAIYSVVDGVFAAKQEAGHAV